MSLTNMSNNSTENIILRNFSEKKGVIYWTKNTQQLPFQSYPYMFAWGQISLALLNQQTWKKEKRKRKPTTKNNEAQKNENLTHSPKLDIDEWSHYGSKGRIPGKTITKRF